jgi:hypothetical protein
MAQVKWSIRNYNAFLRAVKAEHGVSHKQARAVYRAQREKAGRSLYGVDAGKLKGKIKRQLAAEHPKTKRPKVERPKVKREIMPIQTKGELLDAIRADTRKGEWAQAVKKLIRTRAHLIEALDSAEDAEDQDMIRQAFDSPGVE